jgi:hypothetical protein
VIRITKVKKKFHPTKAKVIEVFLEEIYINPAYIVAAYPTNDKHLGSVYCLDVLKGNYTQTMVIPKEEYEKIIKLEEAV